ncbi:uncharacterized protein LOC117341402 [Pecten maximus]|uniref:uncharacterized protein LOC117341402 n=1 Tax=Pecten maximus TaxID=6579 RepID=UPI001459062A|nr:uncharacterized protein LOC117341402 [Pecten maximus]
MLQTGLSFKFHNMVAKGDKEYWITSNSTLAYSATVETSLTDSCELQLPQKIAPEGENKTLASPDKSNVLCKVVQVCIHRIFKNGSPLNYRQGGSLPVRALILKDSQTTAKVCLFWEMQKCSLKKEIWSTFQLFTPKNILTGISLPPSPFQPFTADDPTIFVQGQDASPYLSDPDFEDLESLTISYRQISQTSTSTNAAKLKFQLAGKKKMVDNQCPVCKATTTNRKSYRIAFLYSTEKAKGKKITLFKSTIEKILNIELDPEEQKSSLISAVVGKLPIPIVI